MNAKERRRTERTQPVYCVTMRTISSGEGPVSQIWLVLNVEENNGVVSFEKIVDSPLDSELGVLGGVNRNHNITSHV